VSSARTSGADLKPGRVSAEKFRMADTFSPKWGVCDSRLNETKNLLASMAATATRLFARGPSLCGLKSTILWLYVASNLRSEGETRPWASGRLPADRPTQRCRPAKRHKGPAAPLKVCGTSEGLVVMPHASAHKVTGPEQSEMMRYNGLAFIGLTLIAFSIADFYVVREGFTANSVIYLGGAISSIVIALVAMRWMCPRSHRFGPATRNLLHASAR
jgi:hypothetical protein